MKLTVEYPTIPISLFCCCLHQQRTKKPSNFWSSDCGVLHLLSFFPMLSKVALQSTMIEHLLVHLKYRRCLVFLQVLSIIQNPALKTRQNICHKYSNEYRK
jgi:hypothetical protein